MSVMLIGVFGLVWWYFYFLWLLFFCDFWVWYVMSWFGYLWLIFDLLLMSLIYWFVFM